MADQLIRIPDLVPVSSANGNEIIPVSQDGNPRKMTTDNVKAYVENKILPVNTNGISDKAVTLDKFSDAAKEYIGSAGNITNYPDDVTLESYNDNGTQKLRIKSSAMEQLLSVGVTFDWNNAGSALTKVGNTDLLATIWDAIAKPVTLNDDGTENQQLEENIQYQTNGQASDLTGAQGQCMVRINKFYVKRVFDTTQRLTEIRISLYPLSGYIPHEKFSWGNGRDRIYIGMFEASLVNSKMASVAGQPIYSNVVLATFRSAAAARGAGWHDYDFLTQDLIQTLWYVFFSDMNSQVSLPGYTGGTWIQSWLRPTGRTKVLTSRNGSVAADATNDSDIYSSPNWQDSNKIIANRFLWIENFFGNVWKMLDGITFDGRVSGTKHAWITDDPSKFTSDAATILSTYKDMGIVIPSSPNETWLKSFGKYFIPVEMGGGGNNFTCDYFWSYLADSTRDYFRLVYSGGFLSYGLLAGSAARASDSALARADWYIGSRLCYEKN